MLAHCHLLNLGQFLSMTDEELLFRNAPEHVRKLHTEAKRLRREHERKVFWRGRKAMKKPPEGGSDSRGS